MRRRPAILAVLLALLSPAALEAQASRRPTTPPPPTTTARVERQIVCRGAPIPVGWVLVDDTREASMCGGDNPAALNAYNIWALERYDNRPVGTVIVICASMPTPPGWVVVDVYRAKDACGHPEEAFEVNVKKIQRTR